MNCDTYLKDFSSRLVLKDKEKEHVETSTKYIKSMLYRYFGSEIKEIKVFGSYSRRTVLPRNIDESSDIDIMVVFNNIDRKPQTYLNQLKVFAEYYYKNSIVRQSLPTVVIELNHIKFELVPGQKAFGWSQYFEDMYNIPGRNNEWLNTDVKKFDALLRMANKNNNYKLLPVIRLLKYLNIKKFSYKIPSYQLEHTTARFLLTQLSDMSYLDLIIVALNSINLVTIFDNRRNILLNDFQRIRSLKECGKQAEALNILKQIFY